MLPDGRFTGLDKQFWAHVRTISQQRGYTVRGKQIIKVHSIADITLSLRTLGLRTDHLYDEITLTPTPLGALLEAYFEHRAGVLNTFVEPRLMDSARAGAIFHELYDRLGPQCYIPMNKQKGEKAVKSYLTGIVNMLIEANSGGLSCNYNPGRLTTFSREGLPIRTLARRVDGCFPSVVNPIAIWEIKEYYFTTTFGSRVADGVYETLLDGMELEELREHESIAVQHLLMIDAHYTWWDCGRSYLCRLIDMLHMGYVDEILFGYEVIERLPEIVQGWVSRYQAEG